MAFLDMYRRNLEQKQSEVVRLQKDRADVTKKIANVQDKIASLTREISRASSLSTLKSKQNELERRYKELANSQKKESEFSQKIARKQQEIADLSGKVTKEEIAENKRRENEAKIHSQSITREFNVIHQTLKETQESIRLIREIPESITVLFVAANPLGTNVLRLDEEARSILENIKDGKYRDSVRFETRWAARSLDLLQAINDVEPTIVHFSGHGSSDGKIIFQDKYGEPQFVKQEALVQTMLSSHSNIRLVFLNACYSYSQAEAVVQYVEAAIGMNDSIGDEAARVFAGQFYSSISYGKSVQIAYQQAKAALMLENIPEENTPVLYVQDGIDPSELVIVQPQGN